MAGFVSIVGDGSKLNGLIRRLKGAEQKIPVRVARAAIPVIKKLVYRHFIDTKDPNEKRWAPLKKPTGKPPIRGLRDYFTYDLSAAVIQISNSKWYTKFHQSGTKFIEPRRFLPVRKITLKWRREIEPRIHKEIQKIFGVSE